MSFGKTTLGKAGYAVFSAAFMAATIGLQSVAALRTSAIIACAYPCNAQS